jgi:hypothetical protein
MPGVGRGPNPGPGSSLRQHLEIHVAGQRSLVKGGQFLKSKRLEGHGAQALRRSAEPPALSLRASESIRDAEGELVPRVKINPGHDVAGRLGHAEIDIELRTLVGPAPPAGNRTRRHDANGVGQRSG